MKSGLHVDEFSNGGGLPPGSPEAKAAIHRVGAALNGKAWALGAVIETTKTDAHRPGQERLTDDQVRQIKREIKEKRKNFRRIAAEHNVSYYLVKSISRGASYPDVEIDDDVVAA